MNGILEDDLLKIINHYGVNHQQRKLQEEVFELQEAIIRYEFAKEDNIDCLALDGFEKWDIECFKKFIIEEIADVIVLLDQFLNYYEIDMSDIYKIAEQKIDRQLERIKNENN